MLKKFVCLSVFATLSFVGLCANEIQKQEAQPISETLMQNNEEQGSSHANRLACHKEKKKREKEENSLAKCKRCKTARPTGPQIERAVA